MSQKKKDEAVWEDCGCRLSMATRTFSIDPTAVIPHLCTFGKDEHTKHYIFDRPAFRAATKAPEGSPLSLWIQKRLSEHRLFVAKPPDRPPPPPAPWRYDEHVEDWTVPPGWRLWEPKDKMLTFNDENPMEEYDTNMSFFFMYINVSDPAKQGQMKESVEGWVMACGEGNCLIKGKHPSKLDRCFVTSNHELFAYLWAAGEKLNYFLRDLEIRGRVRHMRRLLDIKVDARVRTGACGHLPNP